MNKANDRYARQEYWELRYESEDCKEWLCDYEAVRHVLRPLIRSDDQILVLGCGNSPFSWELANDGFAQVTSIDYAQPVIDNMRKKYPSLAWTCMDIRKLEYESKSFGIIIEKATLDALMVSERDPWNVSEDGRRLFEQIIGQISRVLTDDGVFISISFTQPHFRLPFLAQEAYMWSVQVYTVGVDFHFYVYVMTKGKPLNTELIDRYLYCRKTIADDSAVITDEDENFLSNIVVCDQE